MAECVRNSIVRSSLIIGILYVRGFAFHVIPYRKTSFIVLFLFLIFPDLKGQVEMVDPNNVGFKTILLTDSSRIYKADTPLQDPLHFRPIEVDIWYPSDQEGKTPLLFGDLFAMLEKRASAYQQETDYTGLTEELALFYVAQLGVGIDGKNLLGIQTQSYQELPPVEGMHPLIVYMTGFNGMGFENYKVLETLARRGFVVMAISSVGRYPGDMTNQKEDMLEQVYDAEYALQYLLHEEKEIRVDSSRMGVLGCSWGGMSAGVLVNRNPAIRAMVSLDGTETHYFGEVDTNLYADGASGSDNDQFIKVIHDEDLMQPERQTIPYLYLESGDKLDDFQPTGEYHYFKRLGSTKYYLRFTNSAHADFLCIPSILKASEASQLIYDNIEKVCVQFFETTLNGRDTFQSYWQELQALPYVSNEPFNIANKRRGFVGSTLRGVVVDKDSAEPLPFVNIGVLNQGWGTVTNYEGTFSLTLQQEFEEDTLKISMIGYDPLEILVSEIEGADSMTIELSESIDELQEIIVVAEAYKEKTLGNKTTSKFLGTGFGYDQLGAEMGIRINVRKQPTFVDAFNFTITYNRLSAETIFRLNFYVVQNGKPGKNILKDNIFVNINPNQTGSISVDLKPYDIVLEQDVLVTLEWVASKGENKEGEGIFFPLSLMSKGTYFKQSSQGRFKKFNSLGVGFNLDVKF